jgi:hypothetical protein
MAQPPRHAVALHRRPDGLSHHQPDPRARIGLVVAPFGMHHKIVFNGSHAIPDRRTELR